MTDHQDGVLEVVAGLRAAYEPRKGPWTDKSPDEQRAITREWVTRLSPYGANVVAEAANEWMFGDKGEFWPTLIDLVRLSQRIARERTAERVRGLPPASNCDGSGWVESENGMVPCPRCNPVLRRIVNSDEWLDWLDGVSLHRLASDVEQKGRGGPLEWVNPMPQSCQIAHSREEIVPMPDHVRVAMANLGRRM